ncbi:MAG: YjbQ family protein [Lentisphaerae bacterium]|nr:YjbQ family protein [Lentisphaerota bacterium]
MVSFSLSTGQSTCWTDITDLVRSAVRELGITDGVITVFVPHTTAGITINENADPDVVRDMVSVLDRLVPREGPYRHAEGNSAAHVKASLLGSSVNVIVEGSALRLGTWQGIYFCEFDGPRRRTVMVR